MHWKNSFCIFPFVLRMNMKTLTQFLILCAGITLTLNSCSKEYYQCEPLAEEDSRWPYNITAEWQQESVDFDFKITSAEDQTAAVLDKPSNDTITVTTSNGTNYLHYLLSERASSNDLTCFKIITNITRCTSCATNNCCNTKGCDHSFCTRKTKDIK